MSNQKAKSHVDVARQLEFERKRARGEISCAECRRLKLKCDKKIPCSSCKRRGCPTICPNGTLSAGQGTRFVLADTKALHTKLEEMSERIRQLEDGLQLAHSAQSSQTHPLLSENLLTVKNGVLQQPRHHSPDESLSHSEQGPESDILETFGTLRIGDDGATRFLGATAASEGLLLLEAQGREEGESVQLHDLLVYTGNAWPFAHIFSNKDEVMELILGQLPTWERASSLCEAYLQNVCRHCGMVTRAQLVEDLLPRIYRRNPEAMKNPMSAHDVALVLVIFALGSAGDLTQPANNNECELFKQLAKVALGLQSVFSFVSLSTVMAVALLANVDLASARKFTLEEAWKVFSFALVLGKSIGLHRDPSRWNLGKEVTNMRRYVFWELYNVDNWQSLASGRQPIFSSGTSDVEYPLDTGVMQCQDGRMIPSFSRTRYRLTKEILAPVAERLSCCAIPLRYIDILDLDRKIREFDDFGILERYKGPDLTGQEVLEKLQIESCRDVVLVYLHRNFFAKAILDNPIDPLKHKFAPSFLAAYRSASTILKRYNEAFKKMGELTARFWPSFAHVLASGVIVGAIPAHCPKYALAHHAYKELDLGIEAFRTVPHHPVSKHGLPILYRLKERGYRALFGSENGINPQGQSNAPIVVPLDAEKEYGEMAILKGGPLVLASHRNSDSQDSQNTSGAQRSETVGFGNSLPNSNVNNFSPNQQEQLFETNSSPSAGGSTSSMSSSSADGTGLVGSLLQESNEPGGTTIHPDVFRWIAGLDSSTNFDSSSWLQATSEAASAVVTESDLAASLAMFQSYTGGPQQESQPGPGSQTNPGFQDYNVDMSLFVPQYSELDNQTSTSATGFFSNPTPSFW